MSDIDNIYYVLKKNTNGEYLLNGKNNIIMKSDNYNACTVKFIDSVINKKSKSDVFILCSKQVDSKYIQILCER